MVLPTSDGRRERRYRRYTAVANTGVPGVSLLSAGESETVKGIHCAAGQVDDAVWIHDLERVLMWRATVSPLATHELTIKYLVTHLVSGVITHVKGCRRSILICIWGNFIRSYLRTPGIPAILVILMKITHLVSGKRLATDDKIYKIIHNVEVLYYGQKNLINASKRYFYRKRGVLMSVYWYYMFCYERIRIRSETELSRLRTCSLGQGARCCWRARRADAVVHGWTVTSFLVK